ncbi:MAG: hypothetical protein PUD73_07525, partial [bacterium]|nr:hypothetical protein [bacterium]
ANQHTTRDRVVAGELRDTYRRKPGGSITLNPNTISVFHLIVVFVADIWGTTIILCAPHGNVILTIVANEVFSAKPFINITNIGGTNLVWYAFWVAEIIATIIVLIMYRFYYKKYVLSLNLQDFQRDKAGIQPGQSTAG